ncbi:DUF4912 domain-containing protein [Spirochaeta isovalerica]|uniref:DUF4912 domain-containing protein n=1 Tax=Spirochaeta isovalerica TaxID=150 RepID=A0A841RF19_9SPIO|nr:DUF4912 domain-containing protein [Spirochaeta isovalerica]MBB6481981.1 hypothetical protein [Spirochaeta isovalerica]
MTKERLQSLSYKSLLEIAERDHLAYDEGIEKEELIALVLDSLEEERLDRERLNNLAVRIEATKYNVSLDEEFDFSSAEEINLPERYNETKIMLMLREPTWGFVYWDLKFDTVKELENDPSFQGLFLRMVELPEAVYSKDDILDYFDIPVNLTDRRRYIKFPTEDSFYTIELFSIHNEEEKLIIRSNFIETSRNYILPSRNAEMNNSDELVRLSGFSSEFGAAVPVASYIKIPQRILPLDAEISEEDY